MTSLAINVNFGNETYAIVIIGGLLLIAFLWYLIDLQTRKLEKRLMQILEELRKPSKS